MTGLQERNGGARRRMCVLTERADGQRDTRLGDDLRDELGEHTDEKTHDTLREDRGCDVDRRPLEDLLEVGRVLELRGRPEGESDHDAQRRDDGVGDLPDRAGEDGRLGRDAGFPEEETDRERESDNKRSDEACCAPTVDRTLGEGEDEADQSAHHEYHAEEVEALPSGNAVGLVGRAREGKEEDGGDAKDEADDGDEAEEPSVVGEHREASENEAEDVA